MWYRKMSIHETPHRDELIHATALFKFLPFICTLEILSGL